MQVGGKPRKLMSWETTEVDQGLRRGSTVSDDCQWLIKLMSAENWSLVYHYEVIGDLEARTFGNRRGMIVARDGLRENGNRGTRDSKHWPHFQRFRWKRE